MIFPEAVFPAFSKGFPPSRKLAQHVARYPLKTHKIYPCKPYSRYTEKVFFNGAVVDKSLITVFPSNWFSMCRLCKQQGRIIDSKNIYVKRFQCFFLKIFDIFLYFYTRPVFVKVIGTDNCLRTHFFNKYSIARARAGMRMRAS